MFLSKAHTETPLQGFPLRTGLTPTTHRQDGRDSHTDIHSQSNLTHLPAWVDTDHWHNYPYTTTISRSQDRPIQATPGHRAEHTRVIMLPLHVIMKNSSVCVCVCVRILGQGTARCARSASVAKKAQRDEEHCTNCQSILDST